MSSTTRCYPKRNNWVAPKPSKGAHSPPQPSGAGHPSIPMQQQPTSTMHSTTTTIVIQQQPTAAVVDKGPRGWSTGMCACFDDCGICLVGLCSCLCCMPFIQCQVSRAAGERSCIGVCCPVALRTKIRTRHDIKGSITDDCYAIACCHYCAMCQMQRELNRHGI